MNQTTRICPNCQSAVPSDAPEGVCPACALRAGFAATSEADAPTRVQSPSGTPLLATDEIAKRIPELEDFELIGRGGMGAVYKARHRNLQRSVAVKVLAPALSDDGRFAERFAREARTLAQLDHPNVVRIYDFGNRDGLYYLVMELIDGVSLRQTIEAGGIQPHEALAMVPDICAALQYAHDQGVVHRDVKPENILVDRNGSIKIADFGLAKLVGNEAGLRLTRPEQIMGTPNYMAPEQIESPDDVDHRADIFALGVVFYELLTGELPVGIFPPPSRRVQVDVRLDDVVLRTLEKEPNLRYQQASELSADVVTLADGGDPLTGRRANLHGERRADRSSRDSAIQVGFEYRSKRTVFGLPLVHICSSRDPEGKKMSTANGIIAIGDIAIGAVAIGGFAFGGIAVGGLAIGIVGIGGCILGLLAALGGVAFGGVAVGGLAIGGFAIGGIAVGMAGLGGENSALQNVLSESAHSRATITAWFILTLSVATAAYSAIYGWMQFVKAKNGQSDA